MQCKNSNWFRMLTPFHWMEFIWKQLSIDHELHKQGETQRQNTEFCFHQKKSGG